MGGFDLGLERAGWTCVGQVEIDPFCLSVLDKHWPDVPKHNDIRTAKEWWLSEEDRPSVQLVCGGFPCQDVSVAGKRAGLGQLDDATRTRTGLFYDAMQFISAVRPEWVLLENVPGLLTSNGGADFGTVLDSLVEGGHPYLEWRVLDSQHFGVPQRRRRVFVVAGTRDPRGSAVLLESEGVRGDLAASDQEGQDVASAARQGAEGGGRPAGVLADRGLVTSLTKSLGDGGPDLAHAQAGWIFPDGYGTGKDHTVAGTVGSVTQSFRTTDLDNAGAYVVGYPDPAGTVTTRIGKGINSTLDDGAVVVEEVAHEEDRPRKRKIVRASAAS